MNQATIIIPCYNAEDSIARTVQSALDQTIPVDVIVVDDCSTDGSFAILQAMAAAEPRLTAVRQGVNCGPSAARNAALRLVKTPWVANLDSDDYLLPGRMERLVAHAERHDLDFVADDIIRVLPGQSPREGFRVWKDEAIGAAAMDLAGFVRQNLQKYAGYRREIGYLKPLMRTEFLRSRDLFFREDMRLAEDYEFYARSLAEGARWEVIDPCGYIAVNRPGSLSKTFSTDTIRKCLDYDRQLLRHPGVDADGRRALREHIHHVNTDYAWRKLIDAAHARSLPSMAAAMFQPPAVVAKLLLYSARRALKMPAIPAPEEVARIPAGETAGLSLT